MKFLTFYKLKSDSGICNTVFHLNASTIKIERPGIYKRENEGLTK